MGLSTLTPEQEERVAREGTNSVVDVVPNTHRYSILRNGDGLFLSSTDGELTYVEHVDDSAVWDVGADGKYTHPLTGVAVDLADHGATAEWGPESLPSAYLESLVNEGHVCMPSLIAPETCVELQRLAAEPSDLPLVMRTPLGIGVSTNPVSMWVIKSYLRADYKLAHSPGFAVLTPQQGIDGTGGWYAQSESGWRFCLIGSRFWLTSGLFHCYSQALRLSLSPWLWAARWLPGVLREFSDRGPLWTTVQYVHHGVHVRTRFSSASLATVDLPVHGRPENGGTCFKIGSRDLNHRPHKEWGNGYSGSEATQFRCPMGTVILYDARTWHRSGMNLTDTDRVAILNACIPGWIMPMGDQSDTYTQMVRSPCLWIACAN